MKSNKRILTCAILSLASLALFAAPKSKDLWVSPEANGTLMTTDGEGKASFSLGKAVDLAGYKYIQIECSSPDSKKIGRLYFNTRYGKKDKDGNQPKSSTVLIYDVSKKSASYQGIVYGVGAKYYDYSWVDNKAVFKTPEKTTFESLDMDVFDANWNRVSGVKVYVKKVTATNEPLGKVWTIDLKKQRFLAGEKWDYCYGYNIKLEDVLDGTLKRGDVITFKLKGKNAFDLGPFSIYLLDEDADWDQIGQPAQMLGFKAGQKIDETIELIVSKVPKNGVVQFSTVNNETDGEFLFLFD